MENSKEMCNTRVLELANGSNVTFESKITISDYDDKDYQELLHEYAKYSRFAYLKIGANLEVNSN